MTDEKPGTELHADTTGPAAEAGADQVRARPRWLVTAIVAGAVVLVAAGVVAAAVGGAWRGGSSRLVLSPAPPTVRPTPPETLPGTPGTDSSQTAGATQTPPGSGAAVGGPDATATAVPATSVPVPDTRSAVTVLMYHHVMPAPDNSIAISPAMFDQQMRYLRDHGFHPISMAQMEAFVLHGEQLPLRPVLITFDDGRMNQIRYAVPILRRYGFTATFFIVQKWAVSPDPTLMHPAQLRQLLADGYDVQSHTGNHWLMVRRHGESYDRLVARDWGAVFGVRAWLRDAIGTPQVRALAYPGGYVDPFAMRLAQEAGYDLAFTTEHGYVFYRGQDQYALPRWNAGARGLRLSTFAKFVSGSLRAAPPARDHTPTVSAP